VRALRRAILGLGRFNELFASVARVIALSLVGVMTAAVLLQVFFRYVLNRPISWTEEFSIFSMIWMAFLVAPIAYRSGANVSIEVIRNLFKGRALAVLQIVLTVLILAILAILFRHSLLYVARGFGSTATSLPVTMGWIYIAMPLGLGGMIAVGLELLLRGLHELISPREPLPPLPGHPVPGMTGVAPNPSETPPEDAR
jgi:TRAP-type C4-dicarboxylate transport system permease small subunit